MSTDTEFRVEFAGLLADVFVASGVTGSGRQVHPFSLSLYLFLLLGVFLSLSLSLLSIFSFDLHSFEKLPRRLLLNTIRLILLSKVHVTSCFSFPLFVYYNVLEWQRWAIRKLTSSGSNLTSRVEDHMLQHRGAEESFYKIRIHKQNFI